MEPRKICSQETMIDQRCIRAEIIRSIEFFLSIYSQALGAPALESTEDIERLKDDPDAFAELLKALDILQVFVNLTNGERVPFQDTLEEGFDKWAVSYDIEYNEYSIGQVAIAFRMEPAEVAVVRTLPRI